MVLLEAQNDNDIFFLAKLFVLVVFLMIVSSIKHASKMLQSTCMYKA